jgi:glycosyltransferase involved in cell wall biosynthesis
MRWRQPLLVFADDFGRHPSSCQHLIRRMAGDRRVLWVNTIGTRRPRLCWSDLRRGVEKLRQWAKPLPAARANDSEQITVINPPMLPTFGSRTARAINRRLIGRAVTKAVRRELDTDPIVITTLPITADIVGHIPAARWIYYCVDDLSAWPGLDAKTLATMECELLAKVDSVGAVSEVLARRAAAAGREATLITHGIDLSLWSDSKPASAHPVLEALAELPRPISLYWGLIDGRLDVPLVQSLADRTTGSVALVGPTQGDVAALRNTAGVAMPGPLPYPLLPQAAKLADVLIMPYAASPVTRAMQPLKLLEYLATDRPVVCADLPAVRDWADCCDVTGHDGFVERVCRRQVTGPTLWQYRARRRRLVTETWEHKAALLESLIDGRLDAPLTWAEEAA